MGGGILMGPGGGRRRAREGRDGRPGTAARRRHLISSRWPAPSSGIGRRAGGGAGREGRRGKWRGDRVRIRMRMLRSGTELACVGSSSGAGGRTGEGWAGGGGGTPARSGWGWMHAFELAW